MQLTKYAFYNAVAGFFEMPTNDATKLLPKHLQSLEVQHQRSILAITAFQFTETEVGSYNEIVLSVIVPQELSRTGQFQMRPSIHLWLESRLQNLGHMP